MKIVLSQFYVDIEEIMLIIEYGRLRFGFLRGNIFDDVANPG